MTNLEQTISRDYCIANKTDPNGNKWGVFHIKGSSLYEVRLEDGTARGKPEELDGRFTKPDYAWKEVDKFLEASWDKADEAKVKKARKDYAKKVEDKEQSAASTG